MLTPRKRPAFAAAALAAAAASALAAGQAHAQQQFSLQHAQSVPLPQFFGAGTMGEPASPFGSNPLSVTFDGTNVFVGGFNGGTTAATAGIVRVDNVLGSVSPTVTGLNPSVFTAQPARGLDYMASHAGAVYALYDEGGANTGGFVRRYDQAGNQQWSVSPTNIVAGYRPTALAIDPLADAGQPALGMVGIGSGRRAALRLSDGAVVYGPSGSTAPLGEIVNPNPNNVNGVTLGFTYRGLAFDSQGNVAVTAAGGTSYGLRDTQGGTNFNRFTNLDGVASSTSPIAVKQTNLDPAGFVGQGLGFLEGLGTQTLLAASHRVGTPFQLTLTSSRPGVPPITDLDSRHVHLFTTTGALPADLRNPTLTGEEDGLGESWTADVKGIAVGRDANNLPALFVVSFVDRRLDVYNLEPEWNASTGGAWSNPANWVFGVVPDGPLDNARFGGAIAGPATITVDAPRTVKVIKFDSPNAYTLSGPSNITLNSPGQPIITAIQGSHTIGVPVALVKDTFVTAQEDQTISVKRFTGAGLEIASGTVRILPDSTSGGTSNVTSLTIAGDTEPAARLDVTNNAFAVDYTGDSPFDTIRAQIVSGYANGAWTGNGITSSQANNTTHGVGYAEASSLSSVPPIFGTVDSTAVLFRHTRYGDANLDGLVNLADFNRLASNFGSTTAFWDDGDFNYDGNVNLADFNRLASNFGLSAAGPEVTPEDWSALASAVPEPTGAALLGLAALGATRRGRRA